MAGQRSSVNEEKRPSPILDHHGTSWETPGDTPIVFTSALFDTPQNIIIPATLIM